MVANGVAIGVNLAPTTAFIVAGGSKRFVDGGGVHVSRRARAMSLGATATAGPPQATLATAEATPSL